ncbi:MOSC domain-containing protein [Chitiniphilus eburneus]|uniref:MOSC domain-containing protein n=1 Tax=Chitiniphilus eburneus TaxID=2571148 RepID=A0A4V5MS13_9NEIS|nr:MOSC N-terminal beta barrel domain-containing protein [Chitiniphilus eburneus]TJZ71058.1 MOSC domain-containing protein [Chitiniphilus eburneus]
MSAIVVSALYRYPLKSAHGHPLTEAQLDHVGLPDDRAWMVADADGRFVTGRDLPRLVQIHAATDATTLTLTAPDQPPLTIPRAVFATPHPAHVWGTDFSAWHGSADADAWLSAFTGRPLKLLYTGETQRRVKRFPDTPVSFADGYPLLLIGDASLAQLSDWAGQALEMARFRPNLTFAGADAFAEDHWQRIRIGEAVIRLTKPCVRCVFTTVDPDNGDKHPRQEPLRTLARHRKTPDGVTFGMNAIVERAGWVRQGDGVEVLD